MTDDTRLDDAPEAEEEVIPTGDVDIADLSTKHNRGETYRTPTIEDTVILLDNDLVPERLVGRRALVIDAGEDQLLSKSEFADHEITVRLRDETNSTLVLPMSAVQLAPGLDTTRRG